MHITAAWFVVSTASARSTDCSPPSSEPEPAPSFLGTRCQVTSKLSQMNFRAVTKPRDYVRTTQSMLNTFQNIFNKAARYSLHSQKRFIGFTIAVKVPLLGLSHLRHYAKRALTIDFPVRRHAIGSPNQLS